MSTEENKAVLRRIFEAINRGDLAMLDDIIADNYVYHSPFGEVKGLDGLKQMFNMFRTAFPDLKATIEDMVAEGDKVAWRSTLRGTHKGELMGIAPTGKKINMAGSGLAHYAGGKELEAWGVADTLVFYQQLGVKPPAPQG
jgi:steroid delta-isomerase-like uncharacterized protein